MCILAVFGQIWFFASCQIQPACCPGNIILYILCTASICILVISNRTVFISKVIQGNRILQIFFVTEVQIALCQRSGILCSNIACPIRRGIGFTAAVIPHCFRCKPLCMVRSIIANFIDERCHGIAGQRCASLKEFVEFIADHLKVCSRSGLLELVFVFIICPAQGRSGKSGSLSAFNCIAGIVEASQCDISGMAIISPRECRSSPYLVAAHICIIEIQRILQQFRIVVQFQICCISRIRTHSNCGCTHCHHRCGNSGKYPVFLSLFLHVCSILSVFQIEHECYYYKDTIICTKCQGELSQKLYIFLCKFTFRFPFISNCEFDSLTKHLLHGIITLDSRFWLHFMEKR